MSSEAKTTADYIQHHLTNLTYGQHSDGTWGFAPVSYTHLTLPTSDLV